MLCTAPPRRRALSVNSEVWHRREETAFPMGLGTLNITVQMLFQILSPALSQITLTFSLQYNIPMVKHADLKRIGQWIFTSIYTYGTTTQINILPVISTPQASRLPPPSQYATTSSKTNLYFSFHLLYLSEVLALFMNGIIHYILSYAWLLLHLVSMKFTHVVVYSYSTFFHHCSIVFQRVNLSILFLLQFGLFPVGGSYK